MKKKFYQDPKFLLFYYLFLIALALLIFFFFFYLNNKENQIERVETVYDGIDDYGNVQPVPIAKDEDSLNAESKLFINRSLTEFEDGTIKITASLDGNNLLKDNFVIQDFVETVRKLQRNT